MKGKGLDIPKIKYSGSGNFLLIAGTCVVESSDLVSEVAEHLFRIAEYYQIPFIFKSSYRKANRSKAGSFSGIGDQEALENGANMLRLSLFENLKIKLAA